MRIFRSVRTVRTALLLSAGVLVPGVCVSGVADGAGLQGTVVDGVTHSSLPGALVHVSGSRTTAKADRNGAFAIADLRPGHYTLDVEYVGYPAQHASVDVGDGGVATIEVALENVNLETVVVSGTRQGERVALQTKKISDSLIDALSANDVGKLPDQNVAEAVGRVPGISIANDQGEGRYVVIRGVAPELANVTLNGATAPAPEPDGRQVKLDDIPSSLISALQVVKTLTPDLDANAIAGTVNIDTLSAFDRATPFVYGRLSYGYYDMNAKSPLEGDVTAGTVFGAGDQFGVVVSANFSRRDLESQNFGSGGPSWANSYNGFTVPDIFQIRDYNLVRKRSGVVANFDWHPTAGTKLYLRTTYSTYSDNETRDRFTLTLPTKAAGYTGQTADTGSFSGTTSTTGVAAARYVRHREESDHTLDTTFGGSTTLGGGELSLEGGYAHAVKADPGRNEYTFKTGKKVAISGTYDLSDFLYVVTPSASAYTASNYAINKLVHTQRRAVEDLYQARGDYLLPVSLFGADDTIKFGFKYSDRHKTNDQTSATIKPTSSTMSVADVSYFGKQATYDGRYTFGPRIDYDAADAYVRAAHGTLSCDASTAGGFACDTATSISDSLTADYDIKESILAGYAMATLKFDALTVIPGVRIETTDGTYKGKSYTAASTFAQGFDQVHTRSYTDAFPGINLRYDFDDSLTARAAVTTAIGRPNYEDLSPYVIVDTTTPAVSEGNPNLKPLKSTNLDAGIEYYLPHQGILSLAVFYKRIGNPIYTQALTGVSGTFAGQTLSGATVTKPLNADNGKVRGVEINAQVPFEFLPSPLDGFGVDANLACVDSEATGAGGRTDPLPMFNQSKVVTNLQFVYEKYGVAARVAYSYRSRFLDTVGASKATDAYEDGHGQLSARIGYQLLDAVGVFVEANNLTDAPWRRYIGNKNHVYENERYGMSVSGGFQFKF